MGERGGEPKRVGRVASGWTLFPPISREDAGKALGVDIPAQVWLEIVNAFREHGFDLDQRTAPRAAVKDGFPDIVAKMSDRLVKMVGQIEAMRGLAHGADPEKRATVEHISGTAERLSGYTGHRLDLDAELDRASEALDRALAIVEFSRDPAAEESREMPTTKEIESNLVARLALILKRAELPCKLGDDREIEGATSADVFLSPFEEFVKKLGLLRGADRTPGTFARRVRDALGGK